jgi:competence protein ComEC
MQRGFMRKVFFVLLVALVLALGGSAHAQFVIHVFDVGQGDAILLEFKSAAILIDAGGEATGDDRYKNHFLSDLNAFFARRIDLNRTLQAVIVTHPHIDHTRFLMDVMDVKNNEFIVKQFYDGGDTKGSGSAQLRPARELPNSQPIKYDVIRDKDIGNDGYTPAGLKDISPGVDIRFLAGSRDCANGNNNSLVVRVKYNDETALFTGDSETDDDEECEDGQVEHLLERYDGTNLLKADVYKVGHHGSHNGTDEALVSAVSPAIAIISAGHEETKGPGPFHGFFFGHPREDVVELLEATTGNRNPPVAGYTYIKGTKNRDATDTILEGRLITKAIYCTCWDGDLTIADKGQGKFAVAGSARQLMDSGNQPRLIDVVDPNQQLGGQPFQFVPASSSDWSDLSPRQKTIRIVALSLIPLFIFVFMRVHEALRERQLEKMADKLIEMSLGGWKFTRFELAALVWRSRADRSIFRFLWPKPRIGINEVVERSVAQLIGSTKIGSPGVNPMGMTVGQCKALIKELERLHSDPKSPKDLIGPLPSTTFLVAAVPTIVLIIAIHAVPSVTNHLAEVSGNNPLLEELWTGLLGTIVGMGATFLKRKSTYRSKPDEPPVISQDPPEKKNQK